MDMSMSSLANPNQGHNTSLMFLKAILNRYFTIKEKFLVLINQSYI